MRHFLGCKKTYSAQSFSQKQIFWPKLAQLTYECKSRNKEQLRLKQIIFQPIWKLNLGHLHWCISSQFWSRIHWEIVKKEYFSNFLSSSRSSGLWSMYSSLFYCFMLLSTVQTQGEGKDTLPSCTRMPWRLAYKNGISIVR